LEQFEAMEAFFTLDALFGFLTLSMLEIVLGIDNLIFIALVVQNIPQTYRKKARMIGLVLALLMRVLMLLGLSWIMSLTEPIMEVSGFALSFKDILLLVGGLFLIGKSTMEIHADLEAREEKGEKKVNVRGGFAAAIAQIVLIDIVFSFDSVITAVGMTNNIPVIIGAMVVAMLVMLVASGYISTFLEKHPTFKVLALSFILLIGVLLLAEGMHFHVPRGYIYFAFAFSIFVEAVNTLARMRREGNGKSKPKAAAKPKAKAKAKK
jgi:predicted tellurium resistance membrane protein TerC